MLQFVIYEEVGTMFFHHSLFNSIYDVFLTGLDVAIIVFAIIGFITVVRYFTRKKK